MAIYTEEMTVNMGPQHPSTHGVLNLKLKTDGEIVHDARPNIGYLHRCAEKIAENVTYPQFIPYTDRMDYVAAMNQNLGYVLGVERLMNVEVPLRAQYIRVIMAELNRIASHLLFMACYALDSGAFTPFLYAFREREMILDLFEATCGARLTYNYIWIGGVSRDLPQGFVDKARQFLDYLSPRVKEYHELFSYNKIFIERTANVGILPKETAIAYGVTGPTLRGSGVRWDLRRDEPYLIYDRFDFDVPVGRGEMGTVGDCWDRYMVRMREIEESAKIVRQALDQYEQLPPGEVRAKVPRALKVPPGEVYMRTEAPRGEIGFYIVSDGGLKPYRVKVRAPSFSNLSVFHEISRGGMIADIVLILGSVDIVLGDIDR